MFQDIDIAILISGGLWAAAIGLLSWYLMHSANTITYVTLADGRRAERRLPVMFRLLLPFAPNLKAFNDAKYNRSREKIGQKLTTGGYDALMTPTEFMSMKILMPIVFGPILVLLMYMAFQRFPGKPGANIREMQLLIFPLVLVLLYVYPGVWLNKMIRMRQKQIERALPFILDLLTLSVEAGLDFMSGIRRIVERSVNTANKAPKKTSFFSAKSEAVGPKIDALGEELIRVFREMQVGKTRKEALRDMAVRTGQPDVKSLVNALIQADDLGVSIGTVLRIQADQMRQRRFQRAEEMANKAPVKMLFPLTCFIFPAVFLILLGPVLLDVAKAGLF